MLLRESCRLHCIDFCILGYRVNCIRFLLGQHLHNIFFGIDLLNEYWLIDHMTMCGLDLKDLNVITALEQQEIVLGCRRIGRCNVSWFEHVFLVFLSWTQAILVVFSYSCTLDYIRRAEGQMKIWVEATISLVIFGGKRPATRKERREISPTAETIFTTKQQYTLTDLGFRAFYEQDLA